MLRRSRSSATLTGRVAESRLVTVMSGDVAGETYAYRITPTNAPDQRVMVLVDSEDCLPLHQDSREYRMSLREGHIVYGVVRDEDRRWTPNLLISSCALVE